MSASGRPRRIVCVHLYDDFSGSSKVFAHALTEIGAAGNELRVVVGSAGQRGFIRATHPVETVFYRFTGNRLVLLAYFALAQFLLFLKVARLCLAWKADVVYANTVLPVGAMLAGWICRRRVVVHVHEVGLGTSRALFKGVLALVRLTASRIICVSAYVREQLQLAPPRAVVVYNSLPPQEWRKAQAYAATHLEREAPEFLVFMACSLKWYKGIDSFFALAARSASAVRPLRFRLALNCDEREWREFAAANPVPPQVDIVLRPPNIYDHYRDASLVLNLSHPEGWVETFGMTLLEAMACAVPVVCPAVGGCRELFTQGQGGWQIASRDLVAIEELIARLAGNRELLLASRRAARGNAERFAPEVFASGLRDALLDG